MPQLLQRPVIIAAATLAGTLAGVAGAADGAPFGVATSAPAAATPGIASFTQVSLALLFVLGSVFALAWLMRRVRVTRRPGAPGIDMLAELSLGPKERVVLVQVERVRLLVGVTAGQVRTLHVLADADERLETVQPTATVGAAPPGFADLLRRSLGR